MWVDHNNFCEIIRKLDNDLTENVTLTDKLKKQDNKSTFAFKV